MTAQAAKMLLVAAGYDPAIEGLTGTDWRSTPTPWPALGIFRNFRARGRASEPRQRRLLIYNALTWR
ncbi:MAG: hypothetical protein ACLSUM_00805 [Dysosmobacter welbionis]